MITQVITPLALVFAAEDMDVDGMACQRGSEYTTTQRREVKG